MKKILACILAVALLTCVFAACGKTEDKGDSSSDLKLALVVAGTFGDRSFYDSSKEGADRLAKDFGVRSAASSAQRKPRNADEERRRSGRRRRVRRLGIL